MGSFGANALYRSLGCKLLETGTGEAILPRTLLPPCSHSRHTCLPTGSPTLLPTRSGEAIPLKDVATSDALLLREPPKEDDPARAVLATLAKAGVHCIVPATALAATPLPGAVCSSSISPDLP